MHCGNLDATPRLGRDCGVQYGFIIYTAGDINSIADLAVEAEDVGWDGIFYWDGIFLERHAEVGDHIYDPWVVLAAIATRTKQIRIGSVLTPLPRRRPWKVARETVSLDHLSRGRLIFPVGLGFVPDGGFSRVGEVTDRHVRAELLDESLDIITGLWTGKPFHYSGRHFHLDEMTFLPPPVQSPRIPIWVAAVWPFEKSMRRAIKYDGVLPETRNPDGTSASVTPDAVRAVKAFIDEHRHSTSTFDIALEGQTPGDDLQQAQATVRAFGEAGLTWWLESLFDPERSASYDEVRQRIRQGPPRVD